MWKSGTFRFTFPEKSTFRVDNRLNTPTSRGSTVTSSKKTPVTNTFSGDWFWFSFWNEIFSKFEIQILVFARSLPLRASWARKARVFVERSWRVRVALRYILNFSLISLSNLEWSDIPYTTCATLLLIHCRVTRYELCSHIDDFTLTLFHCKKKHKRSKSSSEVFQ